MDAGPAFETYRRTRYFAPLDALRFLAITLVVWHHTLDNYVAGARLGSTRLAALERGFLGIDIFFLLSGFLIVTLLLRERDATGDVSLARLFTRRALRLFPLFFGLMALFALAFLFVIPNGTLAPGFFRNLPYYLTFTSNWVALTGFISSYWTLSTQEQFYLSWPMVEKYARRWAVPGALLLLFLNELVNFRVTEPLERAMGLDYARLGILQTTFAPIFLGVLLAHALHDRDTFVRAWRVFGHRWTPLLALVGALAVVSVPLPSISGWPRLAYQALLTLFLGATVAQPANVMAPFLRWRPVLRIGQLSYGIFLLHMVAAWGVDRLAGRLGAQGSWVQFPVVYVITYALAELSFRYFETPFLNLKSLLGGGSRPGAAA